MQYFDTSTRTPKSPEGVGGAVNVRLPEAMAGERNSDSASNSYLVTKNEANYTVVDVSVDSTIVSAAPAYLLGIYVNTALSAHALPIKDDTTTVFTLPASLAAGVMWSPPAAVRFETSLVVDPDNAATGNITVLWRPI